MKFIAVPMFFFGLVAVAAFAQGSNRPLVAEDRGALSMNELAPKGGIGIVRKHLYIDLTTDKNEVILDSGTRRTGQSRDTRELVVFFEGRVWPEGGLPANFHLSTAIVISFEGDTVRFFDFERMRGGYYRRR